MFEDLVEPPSTVSSESTHQDFKALQPVGMIVGIPAPDAQDICSSWQVGKRGKHLI